MQKLASILLGQKQQILTAQGTRYDKNSAKTTNSENFQVEFLTVLQKFWKFSERFAP
jgi:hypothetical protein